ncbi:MAG: 2-amino-4-hydroxy-6-hydroxymethyldihydropteridine diphosphokinase [Cyanobacteria bacterium NC_groundwater_1444_Ag_S-0.65um_54_12]|nr:2-amino-4-hydroxy-6-hydroxymethyldihydropteridine diphosphokinase [Cyanobacteria bacterium NC_groundwater_1444_Ag_S-0.65um_54_12]
MATVYLSLGSNLGDRVNFIKRALSKMAKHPRIVVEGISSFYETEPLEYPNQAWFVNAVCRIRTDMPPRDLLDALQGIEKELNPERIMRWGPRTIDLDILLYDDELIAEPELLIPHIRLHDRSFVLVPLAEIAPEITHPILGLTARELMEQLTRTTEVRCLDSETSARKS